MFSDLCPTNLRYLFGTVLTAGAAVAGILGGQWVLWTGITTMIWSTGLVGTGIGLIGGLVVVGLWVCKDWLGLWTWEAAKTSAWKVVLEACQGNVEKIKSHVVENFEKKLDEIFRKVREHRISPSLDWSECKATGIQRKAQEGYEHVVSRLGEILYQRKERWLGKPSSLKSLCEAARHEREVTKHKSFLPHLSG